jgi:hypothetical protein
LRSVSWAGGLAGAGAGLLDAIARFGAAAVLAVAAVSSAAAQPPAPGGGLRLLDVPYLPQSEALCGGAAAAMVMRYWGATGVYAETFADLVGADRGGIRGEDLLASLRARGWDARSFRGDPALVVAQLGLRRPVVALIEDRPGQFHYVVIVGWAAGRVIAHDPAKAPFRVYREADFVEAWSRSGAWTMLALPPASVGTGEAAARVEAVDESPCGAMVDEAVRLAGAGDRGAARQVLDAAAAACPGSAAPWREMAGLHALDEDWPAAAADARRAIMRDRGDAHAWRILATSEYLAGHDDAALAAWNEVGEPRLDLVNVTGLTRTRYAVASRAMGLEAQALITPATLRLARRRLADIPAARTTRVRYTPGEAGKANVDAVAIERPLLPASWPDSAAMGARALTDRELRIDVSSPTGGGELIRASWRWWEARPAAGLSFLAPAPFGGTWGVHAAAEQETFGAPDGPRAERRTRAAASVSRWSAIGLRWSVSAGAERWRGIGSAAAIDLSLEQRLAGDRLALTGRAGWRRGAAQGATAGLGAEWRSATGAEGQVVLARAGVDTADRRTPMLLWPGAGTGHVRTPLLRAHPLIDDDLISGGVLGRTLAHGGAEWRLWRRAGRWPIRYAPAIFVDTARAFDTAPGFDGRWHVDAGAGLRLNVPGAGVLRVDVAHGLRDGRSRLSVAWTR